MTPTEYMALALRTANLSDSTNRNLLHAAAGITGEGGEVMDMVKKIEFYYKPLDRTKLLEEVGDLAWYCNLLINTLGSTWEEVFEMNIAKLETRYPDLRFCADRAINRDVEAEQQAIASL